MEKQIPEHASKFRNNLLIFVDRFLPFFVDAILNCLPDPTQKAALTLAKSMVIDKAKEHLTSYISDRDRLATVMQEFIVKSNIHWRKIIDEEMTIVEELGIIRQLLIDRLLNQNFITERINSCSQSKEEVLNFMIGACEAVITNDRDNAEMAVNVVYALTCNSINFIITPPESMATKKRLLLSDSTMDIENWIKK